MKKAIQRVLGALAVAGAGLGLAPSAEAQVFGTLDLDPNTADPAGVSGLTDFGTGTNSVTFNASITAFLPSTALDVTSNVGTFQTGVQLNCTGGFFVVSQDGTNPIDGDRVLFCPFPQFAVSSAYLADSD